MHILSTRGVWLVPALMRPGVHSGRESMIGQRIKQARVAAAMTQDEVVAALSEDAGESGADVETGFGDEGDTA